VVLLIDVSQSMAAADADPDRATVARESALSLIKSMSRRVGDRAAVVAFATRGEIRCPMTENLGAVVDAVESSRPGTISPAGSDIAAGLERAIELLGPIEPAEGRSIVLFSDGEDHDGAWTAWLEKLARLHVPVHVVAIGDRTRAELVPSGSSPEPLFYGGKVVTSQRDDQTLIRLARETGGAFVDAGLRSIDLGRLDRERIEPAARLTREVRRTQERADRSAIPLLAGLLCLVPWKDVLGKRRGPILLGLAAVVVIPGAHGPRGDGANLIRNGVEAFRKGDLPSALARFEEAAQADPGHVLPRYNAAEALFALGRYAEAEARYLEALERSDRPLMTKKIHYGMGNARVALGAYRRAVGSYDHVLSVREADRSEASLRVDAAENRAFALDLLRRMESTTPTAAPAEGNRPEQTTRPPSEPQQATPEDVDNPLKGSTTPSEVDQGGESPADSAPRSPREKSQGTGSGVEKGAVNSSTRTRSPDERLADSVARIRDAQKSSLPPGQSTGTISDEKPW
jgi:Ca-activated chloride channel family protein